MLNKQPFIGVCKKLFLKIYKIHSQLSQLFNGEFCEIFQNTVFTTVSENNKNAFWKCLNKGNTWKSIVLIRKYILGTFRKEV